MFTALHPAQKKLSVEHSLYYFPKLYMILYGLLIYVVFFSLCRFTTNRLRALSIEKEDFVGVLTLKGLRIYRYYRKDPVVTKGNYYKNIFFLHFHLKVLTIQKLSFDL